MSFDLSFGLGIAGLILTIYSIYLVVRKKKYPGKLTIVKEDAVGLFNELAKNFEEIKIEYKNAPINKNIIYIKASVINNGEDDLNLNNSEIPVSLKLPAELKWIQSKITSSSSNVTCNAFVSDSNELVFDCGILRINEFFQFEALVETTDSKFNSRNIFNSISPQHRIINTQKIGITSYLNEKDRQKKLTNVKRHLMFMGCLLLFLTGTALYETFFPTSTKFEYVSSNQIYLATPLTDRTVEVEAIETGEEKIISVEYFYKAYVPYIPQKTFLDYLFDGIWFFIFVVGVYAILAVIDFIELRKSRQLSTIIEKQDN